MCLILRKMQIYQNLKLTRTLTLVSTIQNNKQFCDRLSQISAKNRAMIRDTLIEDQRKGNFIRIYPSRDSDIYDQYFTPPRASNKILYKYLYSDEIVSSDLPK